MEGSGERSDDPRLQDDKAGSRSCASDCINRTDLSRLCTCTMEANWWPQLKVPTLVLNRVRVRPELFQRLRRQPPGVRTKTRRRLKRVVKPLHLITSIPLTTELRAILARQGCAATTSNSQGEKNRGDARTPSINYRKTNKGGGGGSQGKRNQRGPSTSQRKTTKGFGGEKDHNNARPPLPKQRKATSNDGDQGEALFSQLEAVVTCEKEVPFLAAGVHIKTEPLSDDELTPVPEVHMRKKKCQKLPHKLFKSYQADKIKEKRERQKGGKLVVTRRTGGVSHRNKETSEERRMGDGGPGRKAREERRMGDGGPGSKVGKKSRKRKRILSAKFVDCSSEDDGDHVTHLWRKKQKPLPKSERPQLQIDGDRDSQLQIGGDRDSQLQIGGDRDSQLQIDGDRDSQLQIGGDRDSQLQTDGDRDSQLQIGGDRDSQLQIGGDRDSQLQTDGDRDSQLHTGGSLVPQPQKRSKEEKAHVKGVSVVGNLVASPELKGVSNKRKSSTPKKNPTDEKPDKSLTTTLQHRLHVACKVKKKAERVRNKPVEAATGKGSLTTEQNGGSTRHSKQQKPPRRRLLDTSSDDGEHQVIEPGPTSRQGCNSGTEATQTTDVLPEPCPRGPEDDGPKKPRRRPQRYPPREKDESVKSAKRLKIQRVVPMEKSNNQQDQLHAEDSGYSGSISSSDASNGARKSSSPVEIQSTILLNDMTLDSQTQNLALLDTRQTTKGLSPRKGESYKDGLYHENSERMFVPPEISNYDTTDHETIHYDSVFMDPSLVLEPPQDLLQIPILQTQESDSSFGGIVSNPQVSLLSSYPLQSDPTLTAAAITIREGNTAVEVVNPTADLPRSIFPDLDNLLDQDLETRQLFEPSQMVIAKVESLSSTDDFTDDILESEQVSSCLKGFEPLPHPAGPSSLTTHVHRANLESDFVSEYINAEIVTPAEMNDIGTEMFSIPYSGACGHFGSEANPSVLVKVFSGDSDGLVPRELDSSTPQRCDGEPESEVVMVGKVAAAQDGGTVRSKRGRLLKPTWKMTVAAMNRNQQPMKGGSQPGKEASQDQLRTMSDGCGSKEAVREHKQSSTTGDVAISSSHLLKTATTKKKNSPPRKKEQVETSSGGHCKVTSRSSDQRMNAAGETPRLFSASIASSAASVSFSLDEVLKEMGGGVPPSHLSSQVASLNSTSSRQGKRKRLKLVRKPMSMVSFAENTSRSNPPSQSEDAPSKSQSDAEEVDKTEGSILEFLQTVEISLAPLDIDDNTLIVAPPPPATLVSGTSLGKEVPPQEPEAISRRKELPAARKSLETEDSVEEEDLIQVHPDDCDFFTRYSGEADPKRRLTPPTMPSPPGSSPNYDPPPVPTLYKKQQVAKWVEQIQIDNPPPPPPSLNFPPIVDHHHFTRPPPEPPEFSRPINWDNHSSHSSVRHTESQHAPGLFNNTSFPAQDGFNGSLFSGKFTLPLFNVTVHERETPIFSSSSRPPSNHNPFSLDLSSLPPPPPPPPSHFPNEAGNPFLASHLPEDVHLARLPPHETGGTLRRYCRSYLRGHCSYYHCKYIHASRDNVPEDVLEDALFRQPLDKIPLDITSHYIADYVSNSLVRTKFPHLVELVRALMDKQYDAAVTHYQLLSSDGVKFTARVLKRLLELCGEQNSTWSGARAMHPPSVAIELFACIRTEQGYLTGGDYFVLMKILAKFDMFMQLYEAYDSMKHGQLAPTPDMIRLIINTAGQMDQRALELLEDIKYCSLRPVEEARLVSQLVETVDLQVLERHSRVLGRWIEDSPDASGKLNFEAFKRLFRAFCASSHWKDLLRLLELSHRFIRDLVGDLASPLINIIKQPGLLVGAVNIIEWMTEEQLSGLGTETWESVMVHCVRNGRTQLVSKFYIILRKQKKRLPKQLMDDVIQMYVKMRNTTAAMVVLKDLLLQSPSSLPPLGLLCQELERVKASQDLLLIVKSQLQMKIVPSADVLQAFINLHTQEKLYSPIADVVKLAHTCGVCLDQEFYQRGLVELRRWGQDQEAISVVYKALRSVELRGGHSGEGSAMASATSGRLNVQHGNEVTKPFNKTAAGPSGVTSRHDHGGTSTLSEAEAPSMSLEGVLNQRTFGSPSCPLQLLEDNGRLGHFEAVAPILVQYNGPCYENQIVHAVWKAITNSTQKPPNALSNLMLYLNQNRISVASGSAPPSGLGGSLTPSDRWLVSQLGVALLKLYESNQQWQSAFVVLHHLHRYGIHYINLSQPTSGLPPLHPHPSPCSVALTAVKICLKVQQVSGALEVLKGCKWIKASCPEELRERTELLVTLAQHCLKSRMFQEGWKCLEAIDTSALQTRFTAVVTNLHNELLQGILALKQTDFALSIYHSMRGMKLRCLPSVFSTLLQNLCEKDQPTIARDLCKTAIAENYYSPLVNRDIFTVTLPVGVVGVEMHLLLESHLRRVAKELGRKELQPLTVLFTAGSRYVLEGVLSRSFSPILRGVFNSDGDNSVTIPAASLQQWLKANCDTGSGKRVIRVKRPVPIESGGGSTPVEPPPLKVMKETGFLSDEGTSSHSLGGDLTQKSDSTTKQRRKQFHADVCKVFVSYLKPYYQDGKFKSDHDYKHLLKVISTRYYKQKKSQGAKDWKVNEAMRKEIAEAVSQMMSKCSVYSQESDGLTCSSE